MDSATLCKKIGYTFNQTELLRQALTHRSHSSPHNERLEFLGDSVLNCAVAGLIFRHFPNLPEGELSRIRANLVNQQALFELAQSLELGSQISLGEGRLRVAGINVRRSWQIHWKPSWARSILTVGLNRPRGSYAPS